MPALLKAGYRVIVPDTLGYMYLHIAAACEELYLLNDMDFLRRIIGELNDV